MFDLCRFLLSNICFKRYTQIDILCKILYRSTNKKSTDGALVLAISVCIATCRSEWQIRLGTTWIIIHVAEMRFVVMIQQPWMETVRDISYYCSDVVPLSMSLQYTFIPY